MTLQSWHSAGWIRPHQTSPEEIRDLFSITDTQLTDASNTSISADSRHYLAYNAALKLCAVLLFAEGYRPEKGKSSHQLAIDSVRHILGEERQDDIDYLQLCRAKRNTSAYDHVGSVSSASAEELIAFTVRFRGEVLHWLRQHHTELAKLVSHF